MVYLATGEILLEFRSKSGSAKSVSDEITLWKVKRIILLRGSSSDKISLFCAQWIERLILHDEFSAKFHRDDARKLRKARSLHQALTTDNVDILRTLFEDRGQLSSTGHV